MPCYNHLFDKNSQLLNAAHRWNMVSEVCAQFGFMKAFDWEMAHEHTGSSYVAMEAITKQYPNYDFSIVIGSDNANIIKDAWFRGADLIEAYPFIVIERASKPLSTDWPRSSPHQVFPFTTAMSSTAIRKAIQEGRNDFAKRHLNPIVWDYITVGSLYGHHKIGLNDAEIQDSSWQADV